MPTVPPEPEARGAPGCGGVQTFRLPGGTITTLPRGSPPPNEVHPIATLTMEMGVAGSGLTDGRVARYDSGFNPLAGSENLIATVQDPVGTPAMA
jgi:hypothetical protein